MLDYKKRLMNVAMLFSLYLVYWNTLKMPDRIVPAHRRTGVCAKNMVVGCIPESGMHVWDI